MNGDSCELFDCTRKMQRPAVPFVPYTQNFQQHCRNTDHAKESLVPARNLQLIGLGFGSAFYATSSQEVLNMLEAISQLADFTIFMDNFLEGRCVLDEPVELTDMRNSAQHRLMSLPSSKILMAAESLDIDIQYESCRLACMSYSLLVILPLPPTVGLFERLARRLRSEIAKLSTAQESFNTDQRKLHFWVLAMAAIICTGLPERQNFLAQFAVQAERLGVKDKLVVIEVLKHFLWHPSTNNNDGLQLWIDMNEARSDNAG